MITTIKQSFLTKKSADGFNASHSDKKYERDLNSKDEKLKKNDHSDMDIHFNDDSWCHGVDI